jgi:aspartate/tyrosine/aromatic aminotransferase
LQAKKVLYEKDLDHEYLPIQGNDNYLRLARELALGQGADGNVVSVQSISGTGANHVGALFLAQQLKPNSVWISDPTWGNHHLLWTIAGPNVTQRIYPYYDASDTSLNFDGMIAALETAEENDVVLLHACAHNPTGIDPTHEQWKAVAELCKRKRLFVFFDSAYQGFASGDVDEDAWAVRYFQQTLFDTERPPVGMCLAQSFAKSFGLYGERAGAFHMVLPAGVPFAGLRSQLLRLIRAEISTCPLYGARIVETILGTPDLRAMWRNDLKTMSGRIKGVRLSLRQEVERLPGSGDWKHLESQIGMFSYTGLSPEHVKRLADKHHVYLMQSGRASLSGVNQGNVKYVAKAFNEVLTGSKI